jgi:hypothetical protein
MSTSIDQRAKDQVTIGSNKEVEFAYMPAQPPQAADYSAATSAMAAADPYSLMASYYPGYYAMPDDMTAAGVWSTADAASSAALSYGYSPLGADYGTMMADYGYAGIGWFPSGDGTTWGTAGPVQTAVKDDQGNAYAAAAAGGYYTMEAVPVYGNASAVDAGQQRDLEVSSVEQQMQRMNIGGGDATRRNGGGGEYKDGLVMTPVGNNVSAAGSSWASVASQPSHMYSLKTRGTSGSASFAPRAPIQATKMHGGGGAESGTWENRAGGEHGRQAHDGWSASRRRPASSSATGASSSRSTDSGMASGGSASGSGLSPTLVHPTQYNPKEFDLNPKSARFFIIKSYAEDDIHRSIKYNIWCSTEYGNKRLDAAFRERDGKGPVYLFFSVNGSGHFCGVAQMMSAVDYQLSAGVWAQDKWKGKFDVKWIYVKDVPNSQLRHIRLENNEGKPVTNSRDTQEVPPEKGCQVLRVIHQYRHTTSIFDDFSHYEKRQEEDDAGKK